MAESFRKLTREFLWERENCRSSHAFGEELIIFRNFATRFVITKLSSELESLMACEASEVVKLVTENDGEEMR